jgi:Glycosyl transferase family 2
VKYLTSILAETSLFISYVITSIKNSSQKKQVTYDLPEFVIRIVLNMLQDFSKKAKHKLSKLLQAVFSNFQKIQFNLIDSFNEVIRSLILNFNVKHIYGPLKITYDKDELVATSLVRNGEIYIKSFIEHHFKLGIKHIIFLDNGSTDRTIEIAQSYDRVTILQTFCPYSKYETIMKKYLVNRFSRGKWNLFVDIDELFEYPSSNILKLNDFLTYLNRNSYTAVVSQMLDMFSDKKMSDLNDEINNDIRTTYSHYDISHVRDFEYKWGKLENKRIKMHVGGIRKALFDTDNGLTKAALVFVDKKVKLFVDFHHVKNANLADITCVLLHYPFTSYFHDKVMEAVKTNRYALSASHEYERYWKIIQMDNDFAIMQSTSYKLSNLNELIDKEFLIISEKYTQWINDIQVSSDN